MYKQVKILLIGDNSTGKSSLIQRYVDDTFDDNIQNTIGFNFKIKKVKIPDNLHDISYISCKLWELSGSHKYMWIMDKYIFDMDAVLFVCDINNINSIYNIIYIWYEYIKRYNINFKIYIAVNKCYQPIYIENINNITFFFKNYSFIKKIFYVSASINKNIDNMFFEIICDILGILDILDKDNQLNTKINTTVDVKQNLLKTKIKSTNKSECSGKCILA